MMKKFLLVVTILATIASSAFAAKKIGAFKAAALDGKPHDGAIFQQASLTMFNVWGTFCPPCLHEMPDLGRLAKEMAPEGVQIIGLLYDWFDMTGSRSETQILTAFWNTAKFSPRHSPAAIRTAPASRHAQPAPYLFIIWASPAFRG